EGKLDEALAIRARIRATRSGGLPVEPAPVSLDFRSTDVGKSFLFDVTGSTHGPLWGTDVYTCDSSLAKAVVHAGLLKKGERGVVRVTVLDTRDRDGFVGSRRNGVASEDWDEWDYGFQVSRA
ncbi:MAG: LCCL domain-containing protein, partial [Actinomycetota bacterium]